jgi:hypothetical protein
VLSPAQSWGDCGAWLSHLQRNQNATFLTIVSKSILIRSTSSSREAYAHELFICRSLCKFLQNSCKGAAMTTYDSALKELAEPRPVGDTIPQAIIRACRATGIDYARAFNIWYRRARRIDAHEAQAIEQALNNKREEEARNELHDLRTRLLKMESRISAESTNRDRTRLSLVRPSNC